MNIAIIKAAGACMHAGNSFSSVHCAMPIIQAARVSTFSAFINLVLHHLLGVV